MGISGNLKTMQLAELLQWLSMGQKTGTLVIEKGPPSNVVKRIFFDEGSIISSASTDPGEYLGRFLVSHGYLEEAAVNEAVAKQKSEGKLLGKILVSMDLISEEDLHQMLRLKAEESIYDIFTWTEGAFEFFDDDLPEQTMVKMSLDVQWIVLEGTRRSDEWRRIQEIVPSPYCVPVLMQAIDHLEIEEFDRSILAWIDDERSVEEISDGTMTNLFQVSEILAAQVATGVVKIIKPRIIEVEVQVPVDAAPAAADPDDSQITEARTAASIDPNESGAFLLPMMQQMMAQQMQMLNQQQAAAMTPPASPAAAPAPAPAPSLESSGVDIGGRQLNFATTGGPAAAPAPAAAAPPPATVSEADRLVQEADNALKRGALSDALIAYRKAKEAPGADAGVEARVTRGEERVVEALENRGVTLTRTPKLKVDMGQLTKLELSPQEGFMLTRVDGSFDIKSILRMSPMPKADALMLFWRLREEGMISL
ncbi:MAG: DUF4388 domain-containing protein [Acidobacteriota bacterium]